MARVDSKNGTILPYYVIIDIHILKTICSFITKYKSMSRVDLSFFSNFQMEQGTCTFGLINSIL
jgi:hypothetical protein